METSINPIQYADLVSYASYKMRQMNIIGNFYDPEDFVNQAYIETKDENMRPVIHGLVRQAFRKDHEISSLDVSTCIRCRSCKQDKPHNEFYVKKENLSLVGITYQVMKICRDCHKHNLKRQRQKVNQDPIKQAEQKEYMKQYYKANKEKLKLASKINGLVKRYNNGALK